MKGTVSMKKLLSGVLSIILICSLFTAAYAQTLIPADPSAEVVDAEIVYLPLKNRIVFGYGSPALPDGIVLKLTYSDGTEKTETVINTDKGYFAGKESITGSVRLTVVSYGLQTETLYVNETTEVEYNYFVIPPILYMIIDFLRGELFVIA